MGFFRLYLAFLIFVAHLGLAALYEGNGNATFNVIKDWGNPVFIFFLISGYFMPLTFNHNYQHEKFFLRLWRFLVNRFLRIFPMYWITILISPILYGYLTNKSQKFKMALQEPVIFLHNFILVGLGYSGYPSFNSITWTLDLEWQYYLLVPFIALIFKVRPIFSISILFIVYIYLQIFWGCESCHPDSLLGPGLVANWFTVGFLIYTLHRKTDILEMGWTYFHQFFFIFAVILFLLSLYFYGFYELSIFYIVHIYICIELFILHRQKFFGRFDRIAGDLSFPVYILHGMMVGPFYTKLYLPVLKSLQVPFTIKFIIFAAFSFGITVIISFIFLILVGWPLDRIRERLKFINC